MKNFMGLVLLISMISNSYGQKIHFFKVKSKRINFGEKLGIHSDTSFQISSSFRISKQITLKQYKQYLSSIEKDSSYAFYLSQLPKIDRQESLTKNYLNSSEFDDEPVIGVSMDNACNFALWYSAIEGNEKIKYRLPAVFEWIIMNEAYANPIKEKASDITLKNVNANKKKNKLEGALLDWTINTFDESAYEFYSSKHFPWGYFYQHTKYDNKVLKRKSVIGKSYRIALSDPIQLARTFFCYADEGYADVGFRLIEVSRKDPILKYAQQEPIQSDIDLKPLPVLKTLPYSVEIVERHTINLQDQIIEYTTKNGQLDGFFNVFKNINNKKIQLVKGEMKSNCRIGYWTIYDENDPAKILIKRLYKSHLEFDQLLPTYSSNKLISFVTNNINPTPGLNEDGCKEYADVTSADFIFSSRLYREILFEKNIFPANSLVESLKEALTSQEIFSYDTSNFSVISRSNPFENFKEDIIGIRIKEDFFFDKNRKLSETRIIGLAPIYFDSTVNEKKELCWLYFPQLRKHLVKLTDPISDSNLDELFYERNFYGEVYKTQNGYEKIDEETRKKDLKFKDIELLLQEHQIWLFLEGFIKEF
jgi:hypothetical protein